jgi:RNA polymerase sigma-70 factor (ECF subfamily)
LQYDELYFEVEKTIESLSAPVRRVFLMSRFEGKKNTSIAEELQISVKTVEAHITKVPAPVAQDAARPVAADSAGPDGDFSF